MTVGYTWLVLHFFMKFVCDDERLSIGKQIFFIVVDMGQLLALCYVIKIFIYI